MSRRPSFWLLPMIFLTIILGAIYGILLWDGREVNESTYTAVSPVPWTPSEGPVCVTWWIEKFRELPTISAPVQLRDSEGEVIDLRRSASPGYAKADGEARLYKSCYDLPDGSKPAPGPAWIVAKQDYQAMFQIVRVIYPEVLIEIAP